METAIAPLTDTHTPSPSETVQLVTAAELVAETPPAPPVEVQAAPAKPDITLTLSPVPAAPVVPPSPTLRTLADYAKLDWSKTDTALAEEVGVTRSRIGQVRRALREKGLRSAATARKASPPAPAPAPPPADLFSDLPPTSAPPEPTPAAPGGAVPPPAPGSEAVNSPAPPDEKKFRLSAEATFDIAAGALVMTVGPEWAPRVIEVNGVKMDERENLVQAIERYYRAKGMPDLPPGVALGAAVAFYSMARFQQPNTREKFGVLWVKVKGFGARIVGFFRRRKPSVEVVK